MPANDSTTRFAKVVAATLIALLVVLLAVPAIIEWNSSKLAKQLSKHIETVEDSQVKIPLRQLAELGDHAIEPLVAAAVSQRASVSMIARQIIEEKVAAWQSILESSDDLLVVEFSISAKKLITTLSNRTNQLGPEGKLWAERLTLAMIELSGKMSASHAGAVLTHCNRILAAVPPNGPRMRTLSATRAIEDPINTTNWNTVQPKLEPLTRASESSLENLARTRPAEPLEFRGRLTKVEQPDFTVATSPVRSELSWSPSQRNLKPTDPQANPLFVSAREENVTSKPEASDNPKVVDVPNPQQMQKQAEVLRQMPTDALLLRLQSANFYQAGIIRVVLGERGFAADELVLLQRAASPNVSDRLQLIEDVSVLPAAAARRILRSLLNDADASVRLQALTALATTNAPDLTALARDLAVNDEDQRVSELASRLLRQAR